MNRTKSGIASVVAKWLLLIVFGAFAASALLTYLVISHRTDGNANKLVQWNVEDVSKDISELADETILDYIDSFIRDKYISSADIKDPAALSTELQNFYGGYGIEVNVINRDGIIVASSVPEYVGYDMHYGEQASEFLVLLDGSTSVFIQDLMGNSFDEQHQMKYAGKRFSDGSGFLQVGLNTETYYAAISRQAMYATTNRRIGESGYLLVCDEEFKIINSYHNIYTGKTIEESGLTTEQINELSNNTGKCRMFKEKSYVCIKHIKGNYVIGVYPEKEALNDIFGVIIASIAFEIVVFIVLFIALNTLLKRKIVYNMVRVNDGLSAIINGNLDEKIEVRDTVEFDTLSTDINATVDRLKGYIEEAENRMAADLAVAREIQSSALPSVFPPFPNRHEIEIFARMEAAKEVGGDFYDFYIPSGNKMAFLIADVSGKSIPGAMFMMKSKEVIRSLADSGLPPAGIFTMANEELCQGNEAEMFLTAWMGFLDLKTGLVNVANAGHNPPVLIRDGKAEFIIMKPGLMLAGMDETIYRQQKLQLQKNDILFLYTDGVTEAMDPDEEQYGEERLIRLLSFGDDYPAPSGNNGIPGAICEMVTADISAFVRGAEQSDDITMLCLRYLGED